MIVFLARGAAAAIVIGTVAAGLAVAREPQLARGMRAFQKCISCHAVAPEERQQRLPGPFLGGIISRRAAALPDFEYSPYMAAQGARGIIWDEATLDRYIADPQSLVPGTTMNFVGIDDPGERADLIAYLKAAR